MTSPTVRRRPLHTAFFCAALVCAVLLPLRAAAAFELADLMAQLGRQRSGEATFTEERHVQGLDHPLQSSGTLSFAAPDKFTRRTLEPRPEVVSVDGSRLTMTRGGRTRSLSLQAAGDMAAVVDAMRATLTGDEALLKRWFIPALTGSKDQWTLSLSPIEADTTEQGPRAGPIRQVRIAGEGAMVRTVEVILADGDRSVMSIRPLP